MGNLLLCHIVDSFGADPDMRICQAADLFLAFARKRILAFTRIGSGYIIQILPNPKHSHADQPIRPGKMPSYAVPSNLNKYRQDPTAELGNIERNLQK